jgi:hypothetical protein
MHRFRGGTSLVLCAALAACHTWEVTPSAIDQNSLAKGSHVRVHVKSGARPELWSARLKPDSLIGRAGRDRIAIATADITSIETARFSNGRTAALVATGVLAVPVGFLLLLFTSDGISY